MTVATGTVKNGTIIVPGLVLPDGAVVTILTDDDSPALKLAPDLQRELQAAIEEADSEVGGAGPEFIEGLKRFG